MNDPLPSRSDAEAALRDAFATAARGGVPDHRPAPPIDWTQLPTVKLAADQTRTPMRPSSWMWSMAAAVVVMLGIGLLVSAQRQQARLSASEAIAQVPLSSQGPSRRPSGTSSARATPGAATAAHGSGRGSPTATPAGSSPAAPASQEATPTHRSSPGQPSSPGSIGAPSSYVVHVVAKRIDAGAAAPHLEIYADASLIATIDVTDTTYQDHSYSVPLSAQALAARSASSTTDVRTLDVVYTNGGPPTAQTGNLSIQSATIGGIALLPVPGTAVYDRGVTVSQALDYLDQVPAQSTMPWSGAMRFAVATKDIALG